MTIVLIVAFIVLLAATIGLPIVFLLELIGWHWTGVPYVPIPKHALQKLPYALSLNENSVVYDLGCGDGRILYSLAKIVPANFVGVEKAPFPYLAFQVRKLFSNASNVRIIRDDIFNVNLQEVSHVVLYLSSEVMDTLLPKLERELQPGSRVVSCDFRFSNRTPNAYIELKGTGRGKALVVYDF